MHPFHAGSQPEILHRQTGLGGLPADIPKVIVVQLSPGSVADEQEAPQLHEANGGGVVGGIEDAPEHILRDRLWPAGQDVTTGRY